jgi:hypothetical protein
MSDFIVQPLDPVFAEAAARRRAQGDPFVRLVEVDAPTGYPCRVTLEYAQPGETVLLFKHNPFAAASPYAEEGPIFARRGARPAALARNMLPDYVRAMPHIAVRGYDDTTAIAYAEVAPGAACEAAIRRAFANGDIVYAHVRAGAYGCFQFRVDRA